jgi:hypothetical protein
VGADAFLVDALVFKTMVGRESQVGSIPMRSRQNQYSQLALIDFALRAGRNAYALAQAVLLR